MEIDEHIHKLRKEICGRMAAPVFTNHIEIEVQREGKQVEVLFMTNNMRLEVNIPFKQISEVKKWLERIMAGTDSTVCLHTIEWDFYFFRQTIGSHLGMGQFWIMNSFAQTRSFQAYVKAKNFVEELYSVLMTKLEIEPSDKIERIQPFEEC